MAFTGGQNGPREGREWERDIWAHHDRHHFPLSLLRERVRRATEAEAGYLSPSSSPSSSVRETECTGGGLLGAILRIEETINFGDARGRFPLKGFLGQRGRGKMVPEIRAYRYSLKSFCIRERTAMHRTGCYNLVGIPHCCANARGIIACNADILPSPRAPPREGRGQSKGSRFPSFCCATNRDQESSEQECSPVSGAAMGGSIRPSVRRE